jgi:uncharacterized protein (TIGR00266 family)
MRHEIRYSPSYSLLIVTMEAGERLRAEAGAMVSMDTSIQMETKLGGGGLGGAFKRAVLGGETLFVNDLIATAPQSEVTLAPALPGDVAAVEIEPGRELYVQSGSYMASTQGVDVDTKFGAGRTFFSGEGLFLLKVTGPGTVFLASYGAIHQVDLGPGQPYIVDTGHMVAFDAGMGYDVRKAGGNWKTTLVGGEGLVVQLTGPGRFYLQTRSPGGLLGWLAPRLPQRSN